MWSNITANNLFCNDKRRTFSAIGLFSFLLVNFYSTRIYTIKAALKTFVFSRISDMFMFFAFLLVINTFNTTDLSLIFLQTPFLTFHYLFISNFAIHFIKFNIRKFNH